MVSLVTNTSVVDCGSTTCRKMLPNALKFWETIRTPTSARAWGSLGSYLDIRHLAEHFLHRLSIGRCTNPRKFKPPLAAQRSQAIQLPNVEMRPHPRLVRRPSLQRMASFRALFRSVLFKIADETLHSELPPIHSAYSGFVQSLAALPLFMLHAISGDDDSSPI